MPGANLQLVAYGAQDIYLTGNPQITFFKVIYRRHSNFAIESIRLPQNHDVNMGNTYKYEIQRRGDLLSSIFLNIRVNDSTDPSISKTYYGFQLIDYVEFHIGGQLIDKQSGEWMILWCDLTNTYDKSLMLDDMVTDTNNTLYIPLQFWFCRNIGLSLPLIALDYHPIQLVIVFKNKNDVIFDTEIQELNIYCDFIFLDTDERRLFVSNTHQYLIEQVQINESNIIDKDEIQFNMSLNFSHPVKELIWIIQDVNGYEYYMQGYELAKTVLIKMNNQYRLSDREGLYFTRVQRYQYHTGAGAYTGPKNVHLYSFALDPEKHQPSGSCNFSRLDSAVISMSLDTITRMTGTQYRLVRVYAVNYNVLRIINGMGGLAYSS
jgi:hypothetical protein